MIRGRGHRCLSNPSMGTRRLQDPSTQDHPIQNPVVDPSIEDAETQEPDVPSHASGPISSRESCSSKRKRGIAKGIPRPSREEDRHPVSISKVGPVGPNKDKFLTKIGVWVKDQANFPFWQKDFNNFPQSNWENMARLAMEYFNIQYSGVLADFLRDKTRKTWNDARSKLYRENYQPYPHCEAIQRVPRGMESMDSVTWTRICEEIFSQPWWKGTSDRNSKNRTHQRVIHVSGRTSFAQRKEDLRTELGREPNRNEMWKQCHIKADGTAANAHTQEVTSRMDAMIEQSMETSGTVDENAIFREVLGPESRGRVHGEGRGIRRQEYFSSLHPTQVVLERHVADLTESQERLSDENRQLKESHERLSDENQQLKESHERLTDENMRLSEVVQGLEAKFQEFSQLFRRDTFVSMTPQMPYSQMPYQQSFTQMLQGGCSRPTHPPAYQRPDDFDPLPHE